MITYLKIEKIKFLIIIAILFLAGGFLVAPGVVSATNLILNPSLEGQTGSAPTNWQQGNWGDNTTLFVYPVEGTGGIGTKATQVKISNYTDGDAKWFFDSINVVPGGFYTFSDKYISTIKSHVVVEFHPTLGGAYSYLEIGAPSASNSWQTFEASFSVPVDMNSITVFHFINAVGELTTDDYSLSQTINNNAFNKGLVSLAFDDGWQSIYTNGIPILNSVGFKSTQYIITNAIGDSANGYMTQAELVAIYNQGHDIEAHTRNHVNLTQILPSILQAEVSGSRSDLLDMSFTPVNNFAYPYGAYNDAIKQAVSDAGFISGRTVDGGFNDKSTDRYELKVQVVERGGPCEIPSVSTVTLDHIKNQILNAAQTNTWLILVFHQIDHISTNCYGDTPEMLQAIVDYLKVSNVDVVTVAEGLNKINNVPPPPADTIAPIIAPHANVSISTTSSSGVMVNYTLPAVTDNIDINLVASCTPFSGLLFPIGNTQVICNAIDSSGNNAQQTAFTVTINFNNVKQKQKITFDKLSNKRYGDADFTINATASSRLAVTFTARGACTVSGTTVHLTNVGICIIIARQSGNSIYNAAPNVYRLFIVTRKK